MTATIIDGRKMADALQEQVAAEVRALAVDGIRCGLATVAVGNDYGSRAYVTRIKRITSRLAVPHQAVTLPADSTQEAVRDTIARLNADASVSGVLILRPLPPHLDEAGIFQELSPAKDIEAVHPDNAGLLALGRPRYLPSTPASVFHVLDEWLDAAGEDRADFYHRSLIVVIGRSNNVGKPAVSLAYDRQAAVESIDVWASRSGRLGWHTRRADVLIVAAGVPGLIRSEHIREGAIVLDVGINPLLDPATGRTRTVGDVDFDDVINRARAITPVPGGIGPVTDVWLVRNTVTAARNALTITATEPK
ncbi:bifunctional 5,10-methylenetetrahydrofolate dehydrogenase/5,10-methenyltetrahydrofolate cyclohydrolase [Actinoallomurus iriomotensis]|uniref:Bifunctional protein FolD n=1 Tax=Actinoallomurus iriomotensis TaxID=478107 RepID=A0A9W6SEC6_9ACTN|nr:tetrahydrofolate dehydrogenase/cyclohydrolase catalytic domain-containing protein [Actinoallomurus iriomotensis]GLY92314.1 bifunctional protein FolD [Actinoallomurus iriomotensis]